MSAINGVSSSSNAWAALNTQRQAKMFAKADSNGDGSVDQSELQTMLTDISDKTGVDISTDADQTFSKMDTNGDGKLSSDELSTGMQSLMPPPPSTMDFAQSRGTSSGDPSDDLFSKIDTNGDGSIDKSEMTAFTDKMKSDSGQSTSSTDDSTQSDDFFSKLDTNGDGKLSQAEFEAGRPDGPPPGGPGGPGGADSASSTSGTGASGGTQSASGGGGSSSATTYDPLDTNKDGVVSELERLVGELKNASSASSGDSTDNSATKTQIADLVKQLYEQFSSNLSQQSGSTLSALA